LLLLVKVRFACNSKPKRKNWESLRVCAFLALSINPSFAAVYTSADLFVIPSGYDPCPVVVCEAMLCGLPVVLSDQIRGRFDLVRPGETGDIFPCGDINALWRIDSKTVVECGRPRGNELNALRRMATCHHKKMSVQRLRPFESPSSARRGQEIEWWSRHHRPHTSRES